MNNVKQINQIPAQVFAIFENADHAFLVKAIQKDGAGNYKNISVHVANMDEVYKMIAPDYIVRFKIFAIGDAITEVEGVSKMNAKEFVKLEEEKKELALMKKLQDKYANRVIAEETLN